MDTSGLYEEFYLLNLRIDKIEKMLERLLYGKPVAYKNMLDTPLNDLCKEYGFTNNSHDDWDNDSIEIENSSWFDLTENEKINFLDNELNQYFKGKNIRTL